MGFHCSSAICTQYHAHATSVTSNTQTVVKQSRSQIWNAQANFFQLPTQIPIAGTGFTGGSPPNAAIVLPSQELDGLKSAPTADEDSAPDGDPAQGDGSSMPQYADGSEAAGGLMVEDVSGDTSFSITGDTASRTAPVAEPGRAMVVTDSPPDDAVPAAGDVSLEPGSEPPGRMEVSATEAASPASSTSVAGGPVKRSRGADSPGVVMAAGLMGVAQFFGGIAKSIANLKPADKAEGAGDGATGTVADADGKAK